MAGSPNMLYCARSMASSPKMKNTMPDVCTMFMR